MVQLSEVVQSVDDVSRVPMTPEQHGGGSWGLRVPAEQLGTVASLEPHIFQRQANGFAPIAVLPRIRMIDKQLVKNLAQSFLYPGGK